MEDNKEKIGFNSGPPNPKMSNKVFKPVYEKTKIRTWSKIFVILGIVFTELLIVFVPILNPSLKKWSIEVFGENNWIVNGTLNGIVIALFIIALISDFMAVLLSSIGRAKEKDGYITYIVILSIHFIVVVILLIIYLINFI